MLKQFHQFTESFNSQASEEDLQAPKSRMFHQSKPLSEEEERSKQKYDLNEFIFPYKKVKGNYQHLDLIEDRD